MQYDINKVKDICSYILPKYYGDDWYRYFTDIRDRINAGKSIFDIGDKVQLGEVFDGNKYNEKIIRLYVEFLYAYTLIFDKENKLTESILKLDSKIDSILRMYDKIDSQNTILQTYISKLNEHSEVFDDIEYHQLDEIQYEYDAIYFPEFEYEVSVNSVTLYDSDKFDILSNNIFDYHNLFLYSQDKDEILSVDYYFKYKGISQISLVEFDLLSYDDLTITNVAIYNPAQLTYVDLTKGVDFYITTSGYTVTIVFNGALTVESLKVTIENHNPVSITDKPILIKPELKSFMIGYANIKENIINYIKNNKFDEAVNYLSTYLSKVNSDNTLNGYLYLFVLGNVKSVYLSNTDLVKSSYTYRLSKPIVGNSIINDVRAFDDSCVVVSELHANNRTLPIPDYSTLNYDVNLGLNYEILMLAYGDNQGNINLTLTPLPLESTTVEIYKATDLMQSNNTPIHTFIYSNMISPDITIESVSNYQYEVFVVKYKSRGRYNLAKELGFPHIYESNILNVNPNIINFTIDTSRLSGSSLPLHSITGNLVRVIDFNNLGQFNTHVVSINDMNYYRQNYNFASITLNVVDSHYTLDVGSYLEYDSVFIGGIEYYIKYVDDDKFDLYADINFQTIVTTFTSGTSVDSVHSYIHIVTDLTPLDKNYVCIKEQVPVTWTGTELIIQTTYDYLPGTLYVYYDDHKLNNIIQWESDVDNIMTSQSDTKIVEIKGVNPNELFTELKSGVNVTVYYQPTTWFQVSDNSYYYYNLTKNYNANYTVTVSDADTIDVELSGLYIDKYIRNSTKWITDGTNYLNVDHPLLVYEPFNIVDTAGNKIKYKSFDYNMGKLKITFETPISGELKIQYYSMPVEIDIETTIISNKYFRYKGFLYLVDTI